MSRILLIFLSFFPLALTGQSYISDTSFVAISFEKAARGYDQAFPASIMLHTGGEYYDYDQRIEGFPYFLEDEFTSGSVTIHGQTFNGILLTYDIHKDKLVLEHYNQHNYFERLELISQWIDSFNIYGYQFFRIDAKKDYDGQLSSGFYNLLYRGDVNVFSKRYKSYLETVSERVIHREFLLKDKFYVVKEGQVIAVRNKGSVLKAFKDEKKELKRRLKRDHTNFKSNFERALVLAAEIYDELKSDL